MKRARKVRAIGFIIIAAMVAVSSLLCAESTPAFSQGTAGKVLMVPREGYSQDLDLMISREVDVMTGLLKSAGLTVDIATTSGSPIIGPSQKIEKVLKLAQVNVNEYAGVLMPCMAVGLFPGPPVAPEAVAVVKKTLAAGKPVASALGSTIILAEGGVLRGKRYAFIADPLKATDTGERDARFADAIYTGPGVTQDGQIITCGVCPYTERRYGWGRGIDPFDPENSTVKLTKAFIAAMGLK
jgi:putative intracellular protease/amidase